ncbi:MAG: glycosyltransferase [Mariprofundaceae bacterium]|nr:glycosyltransferase [Mariprofundaceae bacterium]
MHTLMITSVFPESQSSGAGTRIMEWIHLFLQQGWQVDVACPAAQGEYGDDLRKLGVKTHEIRVNCHDFDDFIAELNPNIVVFDRFTMEEQFAWRVERQCPNALRILETIDLHCLRQARYQQSKQSHRVVLAPKLSDLYGDIAKREIAAIWRSDLSVMISNAEMDILHKTFHIMPELLHYCPFMLNHHHAPKQIANFDDRQHFMTIGNFRHAPNWDAVLWLKQEIWGLIRQQLPKAELHIYGSYAPAKATALHAPKHGFYIEGRAASALAVTHQARVCLAPLRFGAGIKTKLADAMQVGTPSVTTSVGAEGMHGDLPWSGYIEDEPEAFAQAAVHLYQHATAWRQAQQQGFDILQQWFDVEQHPKQLIGHILNIYEALEKHRLHNFTGSMLRHHHHRSTEFMSRWIEAKNT